MAANGASPLWIRVFFRIFTLLDGVVSVYFPPGQTPLSYGEIGQVCTVGAAHPARVKTG
jgi:hypothetical protein